MPNDTKTVEKIYLELLRDVQDHLWQELSPELRSARNGYWSMGIEWKLGRIVDIAKVVGVTPNNRVPIGILASGIYNTVCERFDLDYEPVDEIYISEKYPEHAKYPDYWKLTITKIKQWERMGDD